MLSVINGDGCCRSLRRKVVADVIRRALRIGYTIGRKVKIGTVFGVVVGYNISDSGSYRANRFPLVVETPLGVAKCELSEVELA